MHRKLIDDYWLQLNDLFGIDYFSIHIECCNFLNLYGCCVLQHESFLTFFFL